MDYVKRTRPMHLFRQATAAPTAGCCLAGAIC